MCSVVCCSGAALFVSVISSGLDMVPGLLQLAEGRRDLTKWKQQSQAHISPGIPRMASCYFRLNWAFVFGHVLASWFSTAHD